MLLQGMHESVRLAPHARDPQDVLSTWHARKALPSQIRAITNHLQQQLMHLQTDRQQGMLSSADAKADLMGCLEAVAGDDEGSQVGAHAVRHCMLAAADRLQVSVNSKHASAFSCYNVLTVCCLQGPTWVELSLVRDGLHC